MDLISLTTIGLKAVAEVATLLLGKAEHVERLRKRETRFAQQYKKLVKNLAEEASHIGIQLNAMIQNGDTHTVAKLLKDDNGSDALRKLVTLLAETHAFVLEQEEAADKMLGALQKTEGGDTIAGTLGVDNEDSAFDLVMNDATSDLEAHRSDLRSQYDHLTSLYTIFSTAPESSHSPSSTSSYRHTAGREDLRKVRQDDLMTAFYNRPFRITFAIDTAIDIATDLDIANLNSSPYIATMERLGENWIECQSTGTNEGYFQRLEELEVLVMENLLSSINFEIASYSLKEKIGMPESHDQRRLKGFRTIRQTMGRETERIKARRFSIAFCGMVKAGKSLFLNAMTGQDLLPSNDLPATAWPCRLVHVTGQRIPSLTLDPKYFQIRVTELRKRGNGAAMRSYQPPMANDDYAAILNNCADDHDSGFSGTSSFNRVRQETEKRHIYMSWVDLHEKTKANLLRFEQPNFTIPSGATGKEDVIDLLNIINDIVRLCVRFGISIDKPKNKPETWPLLTVEFECLNELLDANISFEFIDLPGIGESGDEFHEFQDLVREVAREVNAIVPVVSMKEIPREVWRTQLPAIISDGLNRSPDLILCTHLDHVQAKGRVNNLLVDLAKLFYPESSSDDGRNRVVACSTRLGVSAKLLLKRSEKEKPKFSEFWNKDSILYDGAVKLLGDWDSEERYNKMDLNAWNRLLRSLLEKSCLPTSVRRLTKDMVFSSQKRVIESENVVMRKQLNTAIIEQSEVLHRLKRSREEFEKARAQFLVDREIYQKVLDEWAVERVNASPKIHDQLRKELENIETECEKAISKLVEETIGKFLGMGKITLKPIPDLIQTTVRMTFPNPSDAELFLYEVQKVGVDALNKAKRNFVEFVRTLAVKSQASYFKSLRVKIKKRLNDEKIHAALKNEIITDLSEQGANIEVLAFLSIKRKVMQTIAVRHSGSSAFRAIKEAVAKPFLTRRPIDAFLDTHENTRTSRDSVQPEGTPARRYDELGFMLRAPIAAVASVSWLLGSGIWPFMIQSRKIVMNKHEFNEQLRKELVAKVFTNLRKEGQQTLDAIMDNSWLAAKSVVQDELNNEEQKYNTEATQKVNPISEEKLAQSLALLLNFVAVKSALSRLYEDFQQTKTYE